MSASADPSQATSSKHAGDHAQLVRLLKTSAVVANLPCVWGTIQVAASRRAPSERYSFITAPFCDGIQISLGALDLILARKSEVPLRDSVHRQCPFLILKNVLFHRRSD